jgi:hypothetical protein
MGVEGRGGVPPNFDGSRETLLQACQKNPLKFQHGLPITPTQIVGSAGVNEHAITWTSGP